MKAKNLKEGRSIKFEYGGHEFMFTVISNYCECYADNYYQFGFELGQKTLWNPEGKTETDDELIEMLINNYENGNIYIGD